LADDRDVSVYTMTVIDFRSITDLVQHSPAAAGR